MAPARPSRLPARQNSSGRNWKLGLYLQRDIILCTSSIRKAKRRCSVFNLFILIDKTIAAKQHRKNQEEVHKYAEWGSYYEEAAHTWKEGETTLAVKITSPREGKKK